MSRSLRVNPACIEKAKMAVRRSGFLNQQALAEDVGMSLATVSKFLTGKPVDRVTFLELCEKLSLDYDAIALLDPVPNPLDPLPHNDPRRDWGDAMDVTVFYGRTDELQTLQQWVVGDHCRVISLIGMGGIGKTALAIKLAQQVQDGFDGVI